MWRAQRTFEPLAAKAARVGNGHSPVLLVDAVAAAKNGEPTAIELNVRLSNASALGLYESAGFKCSGKLAAYPLDGDPTITLVLSQP